jgi:DNA polymerase-3 subunit delta
MVYQEFAQKIAAGKIAPVYFFYGNEAYFIDQGLEAIFSRFVTSGSVNFNRDIFYGEETEASQIVNTALSIPMMSEKRVVVLKNYNRLPQSGKELILKYCKNPAPHTILVLVTGEVDLRKKGYAELKKLVELVECKSPYEKKIPMHISQFVENRGKKISFRAINLLQAKLGNSLSGIIGQVEKLISFKHDQEEITEEDVERLVGISRSYNIFQLRDAIGSRNTVESLVILRQMVEIGEPPGFIVSSLTNYFIQLLRARELKRRRASRNEMLEQLAVHPFFLDRTVNQAMGFEDSQIARILKLLLEADKNLKTSYQKPKIILELLLLQIMEQNKAA